MLFLHCRKTETRRKVIALGEIKTQRRYPSHSHGQTGQDPNPTWLPPGLGAPCSGLTWGFSGSRYVSEDMRWYLKNILKHWLKPLSGMQDFSKHSICFGCFVYPQVKDRMSRILKITSDGSGKVEQPCWKQPHDGNARDRDKETERKSVWLVAHYVVAIENVKHRRKQSNLFLFHLTSTIPIIYSRWTVFPLYWRTLRGLT